MSELEDLQKQVEALTELVGSITKLNDANSINEVLDDARTTAIYSIVRELAEKAGVAPEAFLQHYTVRFRWWHDYYLRKAEDVNPERAAELDPRTVEQAGVDATYPPIFGPPPP
jgi:hypothetical protein